MKTLNFTVKHCTHANLLPFSGEKVFFVFFKKIKHGHKD